MIDKTVKEQKKSKKRKLTKQEKKDTLTVIAMLATILLVAIVISLFKSKVMNTGEYSGMTNRERRAAAEDARDIMIGAGAVCLVIVVVYVVKRAHRREINDKNFDKLFSEQERIEAARKRVEKARLDRISKEAEKITDTSMKRSRQERLGADTYEQAEVKTLAEIEHMDENERQEYLERRRREYRYYMENDSEDVTNELDELIEEMTDDTKFVNSKRRIIAIVCGIVAIIAIGTAVIIVNI